MSFKIGLIRVFALSILISGNGVVSKDSNDISRSHVHPMSLVRRGSLESQINATEEKEDKVTRIIQSLLAKHDSRVRPFYSTGNASFVVVALTIQVLEVLEQEQEVSSAVVLHQTWVDPRLAFYDVESSGVDSITVMVAHESTHEGFWLPDTIFQNEIKPRHASEDLNVNDAIVLYRNGTVLRMTKLTVNTHCGFDYSEFPFDSQVCELRIGSHAYRKSELEYGWDEEFIMDVEFWADGEGQGKVLSSRRAGGFVVTGVSLNESDSSEFNSGEVSTLMFQITLQRAWRPFVIRFYFPLVLFVLVSLLCLFLGDSKVAFVVSLINLALVNIFIAIRSTSPDLPSKQNCLTAYDSYFIMCLAYMLIVLVIVSFRLAKSDNPILTTNSLQNRSSTTSDHQFPETLVLRRNRLTNDHDMFSGPTTETEERIRDNGFREVYSSPSYPITRVRWRVFGRKVSKFGLWVWKYLRWILVGSFLFTDYMYFKVHSVRYE